MHLWRSRPRRWRWSHAVGAVLHCLYRSLLQLIVGCSGGSGCGPGDSVTTARLCGVSVASFHANCWPSLDDRCNSKHWTSR